MLKIRGHRKDSMLFVWEKDGIRIIITSGFVQINFKLPALGVLKLRTFLNDLDLETTGSTSVTIDEGKIPVDNVTKM